MNHFENSKILAPYDFSKFSLDAVETAIKIAGKNENITVLHVVDPVPLYGYSGDTGLAMGGVPTGDCRTLEWPPRLTMTMCSGP